MKTHLRILVLCLSVQASIFFVAYAKDGVGLDPAKNPLFLSPRNNAVLVTSVRAFQIS